MAWKNILIPTDFSTHSLHALKQGISLAAGLGSTITVLHVSHDPSAIAGLEKDKKAARKSEDAAAELFEIFLKKRKVSKLAKEAGVTLETKITVGHPTREILSFIKKNSPDLVLMGSKGITNLSHMLIGSKALRVLQLSPVPVLIVKTPKGTKRDKRKKDKEALKKSAAKNSSKKNGSKKKSEPSKAKDEQKKKK